MDDSDVSAAKGERVDEKAQSRATVGRLGSKGWFAVKLIVWIGAASGSWAMLIAVSHLARALMR